VVRSHHAAAAAAAVEDTGRSPGVGEGIGRVAGSPAAECRRRELGCSVGVAGRMEAADSRAGLGRNSPAVVEDSLGEEHHRGLGSLEGGS
jgi:hypothetical protein